MTLIYGLQVISFRKIKEKKGFLYEKAVYL